MHLSIPINCLVLGEILSANTQFKEWTPFPVQKNCNVMGDKDIKCVLQRAHSSDYWLVIVLQIWKYFTGWESVFFRVEGRGENLIYKHKMMDQQAEKKKKEKQSHSILKFSPEGF